MLWPLRLKFSTPDNTPAHYHRGDSFDPGNGINVYDGGVANPVCSMLGAATEIAPTPNPFQPPPMILATPKGIYSGLPTILGEWEFTPIMETK